MSAIFSRECEVNCRMLSSIRAKAALDLASLNSGPAMRTLPAKLCRGLRDMLKRSVKILKSRHQTNVGYSARGFARLQNYEKIQAFG